jgi:hypothetical protein
MRADSDEECRRMEAAYREGLGLAAVIAVAEEGGVRIIAASPVADDACVTDEPEELRLWCAREAEADAVAKAATRILRRTSDADAHEAILAAANKLGVVVQTDEEIAAAAASIAARVTLEMRRQQQSGELKSINQAYRSYRLETSARGERALRYDTWMQRYREDLVRQVAATLRQI